MRLNSIVDYAAATLGGLLALGSILRPKRRLARWLFLGGMMCLSADSLLSGLKFRTPPLGQWLEFQKLQLMLACVSSVFWIGFSVTYSRGNPRKSLERCRLLLAAALLLPLLLCLSFPNDILLPTLWEPGWRLGPAGKALNLWLLLSSVVILMNLERTFRAAVGTMRWHIKFVVLGLSVIFGTRIYVLSQAALYSTIPLNLSAVEPSALLLGSVLMTISLLRSRLAEIDVYPSRSLIHQSLTVTLTGIYLLVVGLMARVLSGLGGERGFPLKSFLVLLGLVGLSIVLLSDRIRQRTERLVSRHFRRPLYDHRKVWAAFTRTAGRARNESELCSGASKLVSDTFNVLSVSVWLLDEQQHRLEFQTSTALRVAPAPDPDATHRDWPPLLSSLREAQQPFDLDASKAQWAALLRQCASSNFAHGGHRLCIPMHAGERLLGVMLLADRVSALSFSVEELDLLQCIGSHVAASLLGLKLTEELLQTREQEAVKAVSAFFAHDLKNSTTTLSLMLQNLPLHFEAPAFREDVLRGMAKTVNHMNNLINQLSVFRQQPVIKPVTSDLNAVVAAALQRWPGDRTIELLEDLHPIPPVALDVEQIQKVVTNLLLNAREALSHGGRIHIQTGRQNDWATLSISDNGCGIPPDFLRQSLFRPFQTTKKDGTGIGLFHCKTIVEAHRGWIEAESEPGRGTTFRVLLPLNQILS